MNFRDRYFEALGCESRGDHLIKLLERALETRQFEIELYWKRATYFWAFQLIAFTALGLLFKDGNHFHFRRLLLPASIGVVTALAGYLTARGSKFWQENWESHVDVLENAVEERLTQVILCRQKPQFSVSRINQDLLLLLMISWFVLLIAGAFPGLASWSQRWPTGQGVVILFAVVGACLWLGLRNRTKFIGRRYGSGDDDWTPYRDQDHKKRLFMIWRDGGYNRDA